MPNGPLEPIAVPSPEEVAHENDPGSKIGTNSWAGGYPKHLTDGSDLNNHKGNRSESTREPSRALTHPGLPFKIKGA